MHMKKLLLAVAIGAVLSASTILVPDGLSGMSSAQAKDGGGGGGMAAVTVVAAVAVAAAVAATAATAAVMVEAAAAVIVAAATAAAIMARAIPAIPRHPPLDAAAPMTSRVTTTAYTVPGKWATTTAFIARAKSVTIMACTSAANQVMTKGPD